jgi:hypothetical protein
MSNNNRFKLIDEYLSLNDNYIVYPDEKTALEHLNSLGYKSDTFIKVFVQNNDNQNNLTIYNYFDKTINIQTIPASFVPKRDYNNLTYYSENNPDMNGGVNKLNNNIDNLVNYLEKNNLLSSEDLIKIIPYFIKYIIENNNLLPSKQLMHNINTSNDVDKMFEKEYTEYIYYIKPIYDYILDYTQNPKKQEILLQIFFKLILIITVNNGKRCNNIENLKTFFKQLLNILKN